MCAKMGQKDGIIDFIERDYSIEKPPNYKTSDKNQLLIK